MSEENIPKIKKLKKWYTEELKRRDKIIEELKKENLILIKTALRKSHEHTKNK